MREFARARGARRRLSIATGQVGGTYYVLGAGMAKVIGDHVPNVRVTAEMTVASVDNLKFLRAGQVDLGLTVGVSLADAYRGADAFADRGPAPVRALAHLYDQPTHLVTLARHGIARVADLRGRVVSVQAPGSGSEVESVTTPVTRLLEPAWTPSATSSNRIAIQRSEIAARWSEEKEFFAERHSYSVSERGQTP